MSHILDALKKSELERSRGAAPEFSAAQMMITQKRKKTPAWVYLLVVLLIANIVFVASSYWQTQQIEGGSSVSPSQQADAAITNPIENRSSTLQEPNPKGEFQQNYPNVNGLSAVDAGLTDSQIRMAPDQNQFGRENPNIQSSADDNPREDFIRIDPRPKSNTSQTSDTETLVTNISDLEIPESVAAPRPKPEQSLSANLSGSSFEKNTVATRAAELEVATAPIANTATAMNAENEASIPYLYDMDKAFQQSIPSLVFNSHIYSSDPNRRRIMINDQYLKIGQTVNGLTVEDVTQEGVVLSKNNVSFRLSVIRNWAFGK